jgi:hypothetical protein
MFAKSCIFKRLTVFGHIEFIGCIHDLHCVLTLMYRFPFIRFLSVLLRFAIWV